MTEFQQLVREFNEAVNSPRSAELRANLIEEEGKETIDAIKSRDPIAVLDGLCDLLYVTYGCGDCYNLELHTPQAETEPAEKPLGWGKLEDGLTVFEKGITTAVTALRELHKGETLAGDLKYYLETIANRCWITASQGLAVDLRPFFREVHRTNMHKLSGPKREDGKQLKPADWQPPRIAEMYKELGERDL